MARVFGVGGEEGGVVWIWRSDCYDDEKTAQNDLSTLSITSSSYYYHALVKKLLLKSCSKTEINILKIEVCVQKQNSKSSIHEKNLLPLKKDL